MPSMLTAGGENNKRNKVHRGVKRPSLFASKAMLRVRMMA